MIVRYGDGYFVIVEFQSEFARTEELFVLPAIDVVISGEAREPLRHFVQVMLLDSPEASGFLRSMRIIVLTIVKGRAAPAASLTLAIL